MAINSRTKGAAGEREFAGLIHDQLGIRLVRNLEQARNGGHDLIIHPDEIGPVVDSLNRFAIEVKRYAQISPALIKNWWQQAVAQASAINKQHALAYRANQRNWTILIPAHTVNPALPVSHALDYAAALTIDGFCLLVREVL